MASGTGDRRAIELTRIRAQVRAATAAIESDLESKDGPRLTDARVRLEAVRAQVSQYPSDLRNEVADLHVLAKRLDAAEAEARAVAREAQAAAVERDVWQRQISQIEQLIAGETYPEAKRLADQLAGEATAPQEVRSRARELSIQAERALARIFSGTQFGTTKNTIEKKPPPPL